MSLLTLVASQQWAITENYLDALMALVAREDLPKEFLAGKPEGPFENTYDFDVRDGVAMLPVRGVLTARGNMMSRVSGATSYEYLTRDFAQSAADPGIKAILLIVDSPGGEVNGCHDLRVPRLQEAHHRVRERDGMQRRLLARQRVRPSDRK